MALHGPKMNGGPPTAFLPPLPPQMYLVFLTFGALSVWPITVAIQFGLVVPAHVYAQFWGFTWFCMCTCAAPSPNAIIPRYSL